MMSFFRRLTFTIFMVVMYSLFVLGYPGKTPTKQPANMGRSMIKEKLVMYQLGMIEDLRVLKYQGQTFTYLRMVPYGTDSPLDRGFAFCDNKIQSFIGRGDFIVVTYDPTIHGIGCYDLLGVNTVIPPKLEFEVPPPGPLQVP